MVSNYRCESHYSDVMTNGSGDESVASSVSVAIATSAAAATAPPVAVFAISTPASAPPPTFSTHIPCYAITW